jgi:glutamate dehydrogenase
MTTREVWDLIEKENVGIDVKHLYESLLARAPEDFLKRNEPQTLASIVRESALTLSAFLKSTDEFKISINNHPSGKSRSDSAVIIIAQVDRPFIVDSILEFLRGENKRYDVILHPVINSEQGKALSLNYLEIARFESDTEIEEFSAKLAKVMKSVISVTDDFPEMIARAKALSEQLTENSPKNGNNPEHSEIGSLLLWLIDGGFVFIGYQVVDASSKQILDRLGLFRTSDPAFAATIKEAEEDSNYLLQSDQILLFTKSTSLSPVHRRTQLKLFSVLLPDRKKVAVFSGFLTSRSEVLDVSHFPVIRKKVEAVLVAEQLKPNSHDYKECFSYLNAVPRLDLFQFGVEELREDVRIVLEMQRRHETRLNFRAHSFNRFFTITIHLPRAKFFQETTENIKEFLAKKFSFNENRVSTGEISERVVFVDEQFVTVSFLIPNATSLKDLKLNKETLNAEFTAFIQTWEDKLLSTLISKCGIEEGRRLERFYSQAFPKEYSASVDPQEACFDIGVVESLSAENPFEVSLRKPSNFDAANPTYILKLYQQGNGISLSSVIPVLENTGLEVLLETPHTLHSKGVVLAVISSLTVRPKTAKSIDTEGNAIIPGLRSIFAQTAENDSLNALLIAPGLSIPEIAILRTCAHYLWQIKAFTSQQQIAEALISNPDCAQLLINFFAAKFDPQRFTEKQRASELEAINARFLQQLKSVKLLSHDRVLRSLLNAMVAIVRTNAYQSNNSLRIAIKVDCAKIDKMPTPRPYFEIFVCSPTFEGVHLRGGKVARGGLRWSERPDDFRTEVLGLMKTQMVKNSIIVPVGAKGGFILKGAALKGTTPIYERVKECYKSYIRSLLEITDNIISGKVKPPLNVLRYDGDDPYLVVAADKGTASFSDVANEISVKEFSFWLDDAFASGGSNGYSHKKYGITARGAWECTCRHFRELGHDIDNVPFSVVGIGDMSGDVFGNGLILSNNAKLLAAFDHRHIFLDPNPDPKKSFDERKRMFDLPTSSWADYNASLISKGGGIFDRNEKEIPLSAEIKVALGTETDVVSGQELMRIILSAPVDLLWNGGIGTYVKSTSEDNIAVSDRANDDLRVNATDIRAKIIAEGGNLGMTQRARIEYSELGGRCNTDAVDNSGGVDLSDLEVNLKILLAQPVRRGALSFEERNKILDEHVEEVCQKVLARNRSQSKVISLGAARSKRYLGYYVALIKKYTKDGLLDPRSEVLPDDELFKKRALQRLGLVRPEMAVITAYTKMFIFQELMKSNLPEDEFLNKYLLSYFPRGIVERFHDDTLKHPLRREIISTQVANIFVEMMGSTFLYRTSEDSGAHPIEVVKAFLVSINVLGVADIAREMRQFDHVKTYPEFTEAMQMVTNALDAMTRWMLEFGERRSTISQSLSLYQQSFQKLLRGANSLLGSIEKAQYDAAFSKFKGVGIPEELATRIAACPFGTSFLDIAEISQCSGKDPQEIAGTFKQVSSALKVLTLLAHIKKIDPVDHWESAALRSMITELRDIPGLLTRTLVERGEHSGKALEAYFDREKDRFSRYDAALREFEDKPLSVSALYVLLKQLSSFSS